MKLSVIAAAASFWLAGALAMGQASSAQGSAGGPPNPVTRLEFIPSSTVKVNQLLGEEDNQLKQPTLSRTATRYGIKGTDLGYSFEDNGQALFLFGDTVGTLGKALDTVAATSSTSPDGGVRLDFLTSPGAPYLTVRPPGVDMGPFDVPVSGIDLNGVTYLVVKTSHSETKGQPTDKSLLVKFTRPSGFQVLRQLSALPQGRFIKMSMHLQTGPVDGLPAPEAAGADPYVFIWGTGVYRGSDPYLSIVPSSQFESGKGTLYFAGTDSSGLPKWSPREADARPLFSNGHLGDLSVTWCAPLKLWLMTYDNPGPHRVDFRSSPTPWGPWSDAQTIFDLGRDGLGKFIHAKNSHDGLAGPVIGKGTENPEAVEGGAYAPYVVERWTAVQGSELSIYYVLSTWNPYVVVLMKSRLRISQ